MKAPAHFHQLRQECLPLLQGYHADLLKHDRRMIRSHPGLPFIHITRELGAELMMMFPSSSSAFPPLGETVPYLFGRADRNCLLQNARTFVAYYQKNHPLALVHHYDGRTLRVVSYPEADQILGKYARDVRNDWLLIDRQRATEERQRRLALAA